VIRSPSPVSSGKERAMIDGLDLIIDGDGHVIEVNETYERIDPADSERS
jgi:hypothetical protein